MSKGKAVAVKNTRKVMLAELQELVKTEASSSPNLQLVGAQPGDPNEPFVGLYDADKTSQLNQVSRESDEIVSTFILSIGLGVMGSLFISCGFLAPADILAYNIFMVSLGSLATLPNLLCSGFALKHRKETKNIDKFQKQVIEQNMEALLKWLKDRYSIEITNKHNLKRLKQQMSGVAASEPNHSITIHDDNGHEFNLSSDNEGFYLLQDPSTRPKEIQVQVIESNTSPLTGEALAFYNSIITRQKQLQEITLSVENQHALNRMREDLAHVTKLHNTITTLGSGDTQQVTKVLEALNKELGSIIETEICNAQKELTVQEMYINSRNGESRLAILPLSQIS